MADSTDSSSRDCTTERQQTQNMIAAFLRNEIHKCIEEFDAKIESFAKKEELPEAIKRCVQEKLPQYLCAVTNNAISNRLSESDREELELTVEIVDESASNRQLRLSEAFTLMEQRISFLESRIALILQMKGFRNMSERFKIKDEISEQERSIEQRMASGESGNGFVEDIIKKPEDVPKIEEVNPYDELYYEWRQKKINQSINKKPEDSMRLDRISEIDSNCSINRDSFVQFIKSQDVLD